ncbi:STAS domain-containing protein [Jeotgalibacillus haloalkalitolerans]|uniref:STAS domain-containing protein n=1 Tax=Jeotgalibacillus haloalkalitolerans TaxID=3104292 RepID=A0ABU5KJV1_9BACL|nr:STAS domain-containing protein [Jeotgalibacillus sp. HH7-29]MDZ5711031.1 STAS domain-containing protein [Jeotgalibacillus sp. HH7-29]
MSETIESLKHEINLLNQKLERYEKYIKELSAPIIPSIVPHTILVPLTGRMTEERLTHIMETILYHLQYGDVENVLIDLSGTTINDVDKSDYQLMAAKMRELIGAIKLMGARTIFVGFSPMFAREIVLSGVITDGRIQSFSTFRSALQHIMKDKGFEMNQR